MQPLWDREPALPGHSEQIHQLRQNECMKLQAPQERSTHQNPIRSSYKVTSRDSKSRQLRCHTRKHGSGNNSVVRPTIFEK